MTELEYDIEQFFNAFTNFHSFILEACKGRIEGSILALTYLDSLAGYKYRKNYGNRHRFIEFITNYSDQRDAYKLISMPLLRQKLAKYENGFDKNILFCIKSKFHLQEDNSTFPYGSLNSYFSDAHDLDLYPDKLLSECKNILSEQELGRLRGLMPDFQHASLLWGKYRNNLIHESKFPDDEGWNYFERDCPYYTYTGIPDPISNKIIQMESRFGIPQKFIINTLDSCIRNYKDECVRENINPFFRDAKSN